MSEIGVLGKWIIARIKEGTITPEQGEEILDMVEKIFEKAIDDGFEMGTRKMLGE